MSPEERRKEYRLKNRERQITWQKEDRRKKKLLIFTQYCRGPPFCNCCGEKEIQFLSIDHINGGGSKHRRELGNLRGSYYFYNWLIKKNYPPGYQILCFNCNMSKGMFGVCPHLRKKLETEKVELL